jgi:hypothetical protein
MQVRIALEAISAALSSSRDVVGGGVSVDIERLPFLSTDVEYRQRDQM